MRVDALICVVDDDDSVRESLQGWLKSIGFGVSAFASAEEFLCSGPVDSTDCLILDVRMPGMSGLELQRELIGREICPPIIFVTAHSYERTHALAQQNGAIAVLEKPFGEEVLLHAISVALNRH